MKKIEIIFEKGDGEWWGRIEALKLFLITTVAPTQAEVVENIKDLLADWIEHEGQQSQDWKNVKVETEVKFSYAYDLAGFFQNFPVLKIGELAKLAGLNQSLLRQYVLGLKYPSQKQVEKLETAAQELGKKLAQIQILT